MFTRSIIGVAALLLTQAAAAHECEEGTFLIEPAYPEFAATPFYGKKHKDVLPTGSDFRILRQVLMTGCDGRRLATVTMVNLASGRRLLDPSEVVAVFADGFVAVPKDPEVAVSAGEEFNITLDFGIYEYPILYVTTGQ